MAKDVDLSSKEWRDLIFEGKTKISAHIRCVRHPMAVTIKRLSLL